MVLLGLFAALAGLLAAGGIYGVTSYLVSLRMREIAIRLALGATAGSVRSLVIRQGMSPVLVGIAIGAGTDVAIESADIVLVRSDPRDVTAIVDLARATYRKMVQNLWWATGYNAIAIPVAAGVLYKLGIVLTPAAGAVLMSLSTVIVAINARLLRLHRSGAP